MPTLGKHTCVIAGGGPAGMMTGYLLARAGIDVVVLEKHKNFLRDFRGDTIHPSTLEALGELGLLEAFLQLPHQEVKFADGDIGGERVRMADFTQLKTRCRFIALIPQWDFLDFIAARAKAFPNFTLMMETEAVDLVRDGERVTGVRVRSAAGDAEIAAGLVIATDGRHSVLRCAAGLEVEDLGAPMDVLWFRLARASNDEENILGRVETGQALVMIDRGDYWQCALIIRKGSADTVKAEGLAAFRARIAKLAGRAAVDEIVSLDDVKLLTVAVDRLKTWHRPGLLCIGDAAHAMSPIGGVGINLAIQDAIATANILTPALRRGVVSDDDLARVQARRYLPARATQAFQTTVQRKIIAPVLRGNSTPRVPWIVRVMQRLTFLQRIPAYLIGVGFRPERVDLRVIDGS